MVTTAQSKGGTVQRPALSVFAIALRNERLRFRYSKHEIADQCGVSIKQYDSWENGEAVPDVQRFKRLVGMMRKLAATPPNYSRGTDRATLEDKAVMDIQREAQKIREPEKVPEPEPFHVALRRVRQEQGINQREFGELVKVGGSAVTNWETDVCAPSSESLELIYQALPELKAAIDAGAVIAPEVLRSSRGGKQPKQLVAPAPTQPQPQLSIVKPEPEPAPIARPTIAKPDPAPIHVTKPGDPLADLANRFAAARRRMLQTKRRCEELLGQLADAKLEADTATKEYDEATAAFDALAAEPGQ